MLAIIPMVCFAQPAREREEQGKTRVYFRVGETEIDENYKNNSATLNRFAQVINSCQEDGCARVCRIFVKSSTSPEGGRALNEQLAQGRAKAIAEWLKLKTSVDMAYTVEAMRTDWESIIAYVEKDSNVPYQEEVLTLLRNAPEVWERNGEVLDFRFEKLKTLRNSVPYNYLLKNIFPNVRYAAALATLEWEQPHVLTLASSSQMTFVCQGGSDVIKFQQSLPDDAIPTATCSAEWIHSIVVSNDGVTFSVAENKAHTPRSATILLNYCGVEHTVVVNQEPASCVVAEPTDEMTQESKEELFDGERPFYMAIKTNLLYDLALVPNLSAEFNLGGGFSLAASYTHAWWKNESINWFWRYYGAEASLRWWFGKSSKVKPLQGHHIGATYQIMTYDFQLGKKGILAGKPGGNIFDQPSHTIALEYGYSLPITRHLNIDFVIGAGYNWGIFEEYLSVDGHYVWQSTKRRRYIGPTKLEMSLVWLIGNGNYNRDKGRGANR